MAAGRHDEFDAEAVRALAHAMRRLDGPLLPILHALLDRYGHIDQRAVPVIAEVLNLSRAEVHGVVTFYHDFEHPPRGRHVIKVCCAEACQSVGGRDTVAAFEDVLGVAMGHTTPDGQVSLAPVYCLGNCALSPAALIDGALHGRVDEARARELVRETRR